MHRPGTFSRPLALLVAGATFMELLDGTVLTTAAPKIAPDLRVPTTAMAAPISAYLVAVAAFIPASGWVVDRIGGRRAFTAAVVVFTAASALCAAAPNLALLTVARVVQGLGGALMVPVGRLVVLRAVQRADVVRAVAYITWPALIAPLFGPLVGGTLASYASWRWIFIVNVPLGVLALCFVRLVPAVTAARRRLDVPGLAAVVLCLGCLTAAATLLSDSGGWLAAALLAVAVLSGVAGARHLRRAAEPLISFAAMQVRTFRISQAGGSLFRTGVNAMPFLLPLLFVERFGWTPARAGLFVTALFAGNLAIKPATTPLLRGLGFRGTLLLGVLGSALSIALCAALRPQTAPLIITVLLFCSGAFRSIGFTAYNTIAFADLDPDQLSHANTLASTAQQLAFGMGAAAGALALRLGSLAHLGNAHSSAFVIIAALFVLPAIETARLPRGAGSALVASP